MRELFNLEEFTRTFWCLFWWLGIFQIQEPEYEISDEGLKKRQQLLPLSQKHPEGLSGYQQSSRKLTRLPGDKIIPYFPHGNMHPYFVNWTR